MAVWLPTWKRPLILGSLYDFVSQHLPELKQLNCCSNEAQRIIRIPEDVFTVVFSILESAVQETLSLSLGRRHMICFPDAFSPMDMLFSSQRSMFCSWTSRLFPQPHLWTRSNPKSVWFKRFQVKEGGSRWYSLNRPLRFLGFFPWTHCLFCASFCG